MPKPWQRKLWAEKAAKARAEADSHKRTSLQQAGSSLLQRFSGQSLRDLVPPEPPTLGNMTWEFLEETSSHGLGEVVNPSWLFGPNPKLRRVIWFLIWVGALSAWIWYANRAANDFMSYQSVTSVETTNAASAPFPAVSFCPLSPALHAAKTNMTLRDSSQLTLGELTYKHLELAGALWHALPPILWKCAFTTDVSCQPRVVGERVMSSTWTAFIDDTYGACFTFDPGHLQPAGVDVVLGRDASSGLDLELKILEEHYPHFVGDVGFVVKAHERSNTMPIMSTGGVLVRPGQKTEIRITKKVYERLGYPYHGEAESDGNADAAAPTCCNAVNPVGIPYSDENPFLANKGEIGKGWKGYGECRKEGSWKDKGPLLPLNQSCFSPPSCNVMLLQ